MDSNYTSYLKQFGEASILKELTENLFAHYRSLPSYNKLFTLLLESKDYSSIPGESSKSQLINLLLGLNIPGIEERLLPIYWGLIETFSFYVNDKNFCLFPAENFSFISLFEKFNVKDVSNEPLYIATVPIYVCFNPLFIPSIALPIFEFLNSDKDSHFLAESLLGPAVIFSEYFAYQNSNNLNNFHFLFLEKLSSFNDLKNTSDFYLSLSQKSSHNANKIALQSNLKELPHLSNSWNLDKSLKLFKDYISLNIPPSEIYINGKNEPATMTDIINASWFYFFEKFLDSLLQGDDKKEDGNNELSDFCALILRGIETSNIFRKLLKEE